MARYAGLVGFLTPVEKDYGEYELEGVERKYYGDIFKHSYRTSPDASNTMDDIIMSNQISIVADPYANEHYSDIRYVIHMGVPWKVTYVEISHPRIILTVGGRYNGPRGNT